VHGHLVKRKKCGCCFKNHYHYPRWWDTEE